VELPMKRGIYGWGETAVKMNNMPQLVQIPGIPGSVRVVHYHTVGPTGPNGTQQFPKLTDCELVRILMPLINEKIISVYCNQGGKAKNAQNILANLKPAAECAKGILRRVEAERGYCSCECLRAMHHHQAMEGKMCDLVYRALMVCFSFADLQIQLENICNTDKAERGVHPRPYPTPASIPRHDSETKEDRLKRLIETWEQLHDEIMREANQK
jgi:hypothetical protein